MNRSYIFILIVVIVGFIVEFICGTRYGRISMQENLVKSGHALYYLNKDNNKTWRLLTPEEMRNTPKIITNGVVKN